MRRNKRSITRRRTPAGVTRIMRSRGPTWVVSASRAKREDSRWNIRARLCLVPAYAASAVLGTEMLRRQVIREFSDRVAPGVPTGVRSG